MSTVAPDIRTLNVRQATPESVAPYGQILGYHPGAQAMPIDFYGGAVRVHRVVDFVSDEQTELPLTRVQRRPFEVRWLERHFKHTQTFIPLSGAPFVVVMAPPNDEELPDIDAAEAFLFDGSAGFTMKLGTWHEFPFALQDDTDLIVMLRKEATDGLIRDNVVQDEAQSPDLDKKDLVKRRNITLRFDI
jgi:ureidoglycolate lyase